MSTPANDYTNIEYFNDLKYFNNLLEKEEKDMIKDIFQVFSEYKDFEKSYVKADIWDRKSNYYDLRKKYYFLLSLFGKFMDTFRNDNVLRNFFY